MESQEAVLATLATGFNRYLTYQARCPLDPGWPCGPSRVGRLQTNALPSDVWNTPKVSSSNTAFPLGSIEVRSFGKEDTLDSAQVRQQIHNKPDLNEDDNLPVIVLANNRRVDIFLSTTGQQSVHRYPFNLNDALELISEKGVEKQPSKKKPLKK
jgi:hypothetical protein